MWLFIYLFIRSFPEFNEEGKLTGYKVGHASSLMHTFRTLVEYYHWDIEVALQFFTSNPARILQVDDQKGYIKKGHDADLVLLDANLQIEYVFAKGKLVKTPGWVKKGMFEA